VSRCAPELSKPENAKLGIAAPVLLMLLRIVQEIGVGGEFGGATSLLAEFGAKRRFRAFRMSLANLGISLGLISASAVFLVLSKSFATSFWVLEMAVRTPLMNCQRLRLPKPPFIQQPPVLGLEYPHSTVDILASARCLVPGCDLCVGGRVFDFEGANVSYS